MSYSLGVDLGTSFVAAAIRRPSGSEMVTLSPQSVVAPALVFLRDNGALVTGDAALRRGVVRPDRVGRDLKRCLGTPVPVLLGDRPFTVTELMGALLRSVVRQAVATEGAQPERVVLTVPGSWQPARRALFRRVASVAGLSAVDLVTEAEAAIAAHDFTVQWSAGGQAFAVYDLGGGRFEATVVRRRPDGLEILGTPEGNDRLGGVEFDESVLRFVNESCDGAVGRADRTELPIELAVSRLRQKCVIAKESLSSDVEVTIPALLRDRHVRVNLSRAHFESLVRAHIVSTTEVLHRVLRSANLAPSDLGGVLLVGGSSRIPLVAEVLKQGLACPIVISPDPQHTVALGAAALAVGGVTQVGTVSLRVTQPCTAINGQVSLGGEGSHSGPLAVGDSLPMLKAVGHIPEAAAVALADQCRAGWRNGPRLSDGTALADLTHNDLAVSAVRPELARSGRSSNPKEYETPAAAQPDQRSGGCTRRSWRLAGAAAALIAVVAAAVLFLRGSGSSAPLSPILPTPLEPASTLRLAASVDSPGLAATVMVAGAPQAGAVSPDGKLAYVTSPDTHSITLLNTETNAVVGSIPITQGPPQFVAFTPDGRFAYVSVYDEIRGTGSAVVEIDTASRVVVATIPMEKYPYALAVSPNGRRLYVPNHDVDLVTVVDVSTNAVEKKITVKPSPHAVAFSADGRWAYVANHLSNVVTVVDVSNGAIMSEIPVGKSPHSIVAFSDGSRVYVVNYDGNSVSVIDARSNAVTATIPVQLEPQSIAVAPDARHVYVVNDGANTVSVIDTATNQVTANVPTGRDPTTVFLTPDGTRAYVTNISSDNVTVLDTAR